MTRYVVIGAGAVGATTAAQLHEAGREVVLVARGQHLELLREHGLSYVTPTGTRRIRLPVVGGPAELELTGSDVLVLATKSQDTEAALQQWAWQPVTGGSSAALELPLLVLQNGLDSARAALRRFTDVIDAVVLVPASYLVPGEVVSPGVPHVGALFLGAAAGDVAPLPAVADDLRAAGYLVQVVPEIARWKAGKLAGNLGYNVDALAAPGPARDALARALRAEAAAVFAAAGIEPLDPHRDGALDLATVRVQDIPGHERSGSSTWQSLARTRTQESDYLNGEIVLLGRLHGVDAPVNRFVQSRLAAAARDGLAPGSLTDADLPVLPAAGPASDPRTSVLVDVATLHAALDGPDAPLLLDVRWALGDPDGHAHYLDGHLPGAVYVDLDTELAAAPSPPAGRHPLPPLDELQRAARRWGVRRGRPVVVYDDNGGLSAARAWWLLRWAGVPDVRILDGALGAWRAAGLDLETGDVRPEPGDAELVAGHLPVLTADDAAALPGHGVLLDARAAERYRGETEPIDPRAGHVPGAISAPTGDNLGPDGRFADSGQLRARFDALGVQPGGPVGVYCGSGVTAAHQVAALATVGIDAALFAGSWSAWSSDPARPVAVGPTPADLIDEGALL